ncbi:hypothetical protein [Pseudomonas rustica]|uniref:hypothetical protein n=1 Tax=Pseudomonas rustica TaxID=2827099 RepID=UPI001BB0AFF9|nr:hypothetical protein [Pseudomonas rustica]MBS4087216.1 hypothetical protein [Pseudomonas rustica]
MECKISCKESNALVKARIGKRQSLPVEVFRSARVQAFGAVDSNSPTKDLDAIVLANTLVGYGDNISLENMAIIENIIKFSKLEANFEVPGNEPEAWYRAFVQCMEDAGCFVADSGYSVYKKSTQQLTMDNIVVDIVKAGIAAAKAAIPGATVLSAITDSTLDALKKEPEAINLLNREVTKDKGVRLAVMPCDQLKNGIILTSLSSIDSVGGGNETSPLFFNWKTTNRSIFRGSAYITFNPLRYGDLKGDLEEYLGEHFKAALSKRFQRRKTK